MSWASSIAAGLCKQEVIKSAYSSGRQLINSTFSPRWGAETHTGGINLSLASLLSPRMPVFFFLLCFFFLSFKEKMEIVSDRLESELTELCVRNLFIMIWYCSGQHVCSAGDHPAIPSTTGSKRRAAQPAAGRGPGAVCYALPLGKGLPELEPGARTRRWVDAAWSQCLLFACPPLSSAAAVQGRRCGWRQEQLLGVVCWPHP